jgi:hypothetical protein
MMVEQLKAIVKNYFESINHTAFTCHLSMETPTVEYTIYKQLNDGSILYLTKYLDIETVMTSGIADQLVKASIDAAMIEFQESTQEYDSQP